MHCPTTRAFRRPHRGARGFTLIEVMIVVAILGILAAVAYPSYRSYVQKSRRADAVAALAQLQQAQERWRANNPAYASTTSALGVANPSSGYYTLALSAVSATGYTATATAAGSQAADSKCTSLSITVAAGNITYGATGSAPAAQCWNR